MRDQPTRKAGFVAGAGTEIGKTYTTAALARALRSSNDRVRVLKPLVSGIPVINDPAFAESDTAILLEAQGLPINIETVDACSPWRFFAPLAPNMAAALEGRNLKLSEIVDWCRFQIDNQILNTHFLIEGVGGVMSPITDTATGLDLVKELSLPVLLVSGSYLGAINHVLTAYETLVAHQISILGIVVSESLQAPISPESVVEAIRYYVGVPVFCLTRGASCSVELASLVRQ